MLYYGEFKMNYKEIKTIDINAFNWFDKINGNSYFSAFIVQLVLSAKNK